MTPSYTSSLTTTSSSVATSIYITSHNQNNTTLATVIEQDPLYITLIKGVFMLIIVLGAILGNILVIVSVMRVRRLRRLTNTFIASLAFADLLVAMFVMPFNMSLFILNGKWIFNSKIMCDIFNASDVMFSTASLLHLCCISLDRYIAVMDPLRYRSRMTKRRVAVMLVCVWIASALLSHVPVHTGLYTTTSNLNYLLTNQDRCRFCVHPTYSIISSSISFWIPLFIMIFAYLRILLEANKQEQQMRRAMGLSSGRGSDPNAEVSLVRRGCRCLRSASPASSSSSEEPVSRRESERQPSLARRNSFRSEHRRQHREHKAAKTLGIVMGAFVVCWLPFFIWYLCDTWLRQCERIDPNPSQVAGGVLFWIGYLNSCLNPMIYAYFNRDFRTAFMRVLHLQNSKRNNGYMANSDSGNRRVSPRVKLRSPQRNGDHPALL